MKTYLCNKKLVLISTLILALSVVFLVGCGGPKQTPEEVVTSFSEGFAKKDFKSINELVDEPSEKIDDFSGIGEEIAKETGLTKEAADALTNAMFNAKVEVGKAKIDGEHAIVPAKVNSIDMNKMFELATAQVMDKIDISNIPDEKELMTIISDTMIEMLKDEKEVFSVKDVDCHLVLKNKEWKLEVDKIDDFLSALTGNVNLPEEE